MTYSITSFKSNHSHYSFYNAQVEFGTLVKLFGDWFSYNTLNQYSNICVDLAIDLAVGTTLISNNNIQVHVWLNSEFIDQEIIFKNIGSQLIYLLDDLVANGAGTKEEV